MKILLAIPSNKPRKAEDGAIRWVPRLGYDYAMFIPRNKRAKYIELIDDTNYHWYLDIQPDHLISRENPVEYAKAKGYDLLVTVPEDLMAWRKGTAFKDKDLIYGFPAIGNARGWFNEHPKARIKRWPNGVTMERL